MKVVKDGTKYHIHCTDEEFEDVLLCVARELFSLREEIDRRKRIGRPCQSDEETFSELQHIHNALSGRGF